MSKKTINSIAINSYKTRFIEIFCRGEMIPITNFTNVIHVVLLYNIFITVLTIGEDLAPSLGGENFAYQNLSMTFFRKKIPFLCRKFLMTLFF